MANSRSHRRKMMIGKRLVAVIFFASALALGAPGSGDLSLNALAATKAVSAKVGKPIQDAQNLMQQNKFREALNKVNEADKVSGKSAYEQFVVNDMKASLYSRLGNYTSAAQAYEAVIASGQISGSALAARQRAVVSMYYQAGYADFSHGNYAAAAANANKAIQLQQSAGRAADEPSLQLLMQAQQKSGDMKGYGKTLERLVRSYPKPRYWADLLSSLKQKPGNSDKLKLDIYRLQYAAGALVTAKDYTDMATAALINGFPVEAKTVLEEGFKAGILRQEREKRLLDQAKQAAAANQKALTQLESAAEASPEGQADVDLGEAYASYGQYDKAIAAFQRGLGKDGVKNPEEAKLNLARVYLLANNKAKARQTFTSIGGEDGTAEIARLWLIHLS